MSASRVWLPKVGLSNNATEQQGPWLTIFDFLMAYFPFIPHGVLLERLSRGDIVTETGEVVTPKTPYQAEIHVFYYRDVPDEPRIPFEEKILFRDDNIIVVDKPHFVPVTPSGRFVRECLLSRLKRRYNSEEISPIHRLDRETAGVILFSCNAKERGAYQVLFEERKVKKTYEAIAPVSKGVSKQKPERDFPFRHRSHIVSTEAPFFIMREEPGAAPNTETLISVMETKGDLARYQLEPVTGKQHQLRVHMMSMGCSIINDPFYPELLPNKGEDYSKPLQLLAKKIQFTDPITQEERVFESEITLNPF